MLRSDYMRYCITWWHEHCITKRVLNTLGVLTFQVEYRNQNRPLDNFLIAFISPFLLTLIGILIPLNYYILVLKVTCLMNLFNLLPFTADGEVILLSIVQLIQKEKNSEK